MARQIIGRGAAANDGTGDTAREAARKINENFQELYDRRLVRAGWAFADLAARDAASVTADDIGFVCFVETPAAYYELRAVTPSVQWERTTGVLTDADVPATVVEVAGASRTLGLADRGRYLRFVATGAKTLDVTTATGGADGEYHIRNAAASGNLTITATGVTIHAPAGGTLVLEPRMTATLKRVAGNVFDLFGQTTGA